MKSLFWFVGIVLLLGVWFGINIAKDKPLLSNPFENRDIRERVTDGAKEVLRESKEAVLKKLQQ